MIPLREFILAGKATFTLTDDQDGSHFTYRVWNPTQNSVNFGKPVKHVSLGSDYQNSMYLGKLDTETLELDTFRGPGVPSVRLFRRFCADIAQELPTQIEFRHEGKCCVCNRPLTNPESIDRGIGPECSGQGYTREKTPAILNMEELGLDGLI